MLEVSVPPMPFSIASARVCPAPPDLAPPPAAARPRSSRAPLPSRRGTRAGLRRLLRARTCQEAVGGAADPAGPDVCQVRVRQQYGPAERGACDSESMVGGRGIGQVERGEGKQRLTRPASSRPISSLNSANLDRDLVNQVPPSPALARVLRVRRSSFCRMAAPLRRSAPRPRPARRDAPFPAGRGPCSCKPDRRRRTPAVALSEAQ